MYFLLQLYGEVDKSFAEKFNNELGNVWTLIDYHGNRHVVTYKRSSVRPLMTEGWADLRRFYEISGDHCVGLRYVGDSTFQVTVFKKPSSPKSFPRFHSHYRRQVNVEQERPNLAETSERKNRCNEPFISFSITLTKYKASGSQLVCVLHNILFMLIFWFPKQYYL